MDFALAYLVRRFFYRFFDFFHHWYVDGSRAFERRFILTLQSVDQTVALRITLRHLAEPLYKDYTVIGRILGIIFRSGRILIGLVFYVFIVIAFVIAYLIWLAIPAIIIFYAATGRP